MRGTGPQPFWLVPPRCGLHAETAVLSAAESGRTSCCTYRLAKQVRGWNADDLDLRQEGLVLKVRGPVCYHVGPTLRGWRPPQGLCRTELGRRLVPMGFRGVIAVKKPDLGGFSSFLHGLSCIRFPKSQKQPRSSRPSSRSTTTSMATSRPKRLPNRSATTVAAPWRGVALASRWVRSTAPHEPRTDPSLDTCPPVPCINRASLSEGMRGWQRKPWNGWLRYARKPTVRPAARSV